MCLLAGEGRKRTGRQPHEDPESARAPPSFQGAFVSGRVERPPSRSPSLPSCRSRPVLPSFLLSLSAKRLTLQPLKLQPFPYLLAGLVKAARRLSPRRPADDLRPHSKGTNASHEEMGGLAPVRATPRLFPKQTVLSGVGQTHAPAWSAAPTEAPGAGRGGCLGGRRCRRGAERKERSCFLKKFKLRFRSFFKQFFLAWTLL